MTTRQTIKFLNSLPGAFDDLYWNMADTSYREECFIELWRTCKWPRKQAAYIIRKCFVKENRKLLLQIVDGKAKEIMGTYAKIS